MFCPNCGKELTDGSRFCTKCGAAVHDDSTNIPDQSKRKGLLVGAVVAVAVLVVGAIIAFAFMRAYSDAPNFPDETDAQPTLDLSDPNDYRRVNEFLSTFAKIWDAEASFSAEASTCEERAFLIVHYCELDDEAVVEAKADYGTYSVPGEGAGALEGYRFRIDADTVSDYMMRLFGMQDDLEGISGLVLQEIQLHEGYVYFGGLQLGIPKGLALAKSATPLGDDMYQVAFDTYAIHLGIYNDIGQECYSYTPEQMMEATHAKVPASAGTAVVRMGSDGSLSLVSYDASVARLFEELNFEEWASITPADEATRIETTYYSIDIPAVYGDITYEVDETFTDVYGGDSFGCFSKVHIGSGLFLVACISDGYNWQGSYEIRDLGEIPALPGYHLSVATAYLESTDPESYRLLLVDKLDELAACVQLSEAAQVPAAPAFRINTGDEACAYIIERLEATGNNVPPRVECTGEVEGGFRVRGYVEMKQGAYEYEVTQFWYDVSPDGSIYDTTFEREINPETMS